MIPLDGRFYSAFPLGSVLTMLPLAVLKQFRLIESFAGAWHIALGFAVVGQLAALYFIFIRYNPTLAGPFFALAFGGFDHRFGHRNQPDRKM